MPERVVTFDIEAMLGVPVIACVAVQYNNIGVPGPLRGGSFLSIVAVLPAGTANAASLHPFVYEAIGNAPARLRNDDGGHRHNVWGWMPRQNALDPGKPDEAQQINAQRGAALYFDLGRHINARVLRARTLPVLGTKRAYELLVDDATDPLDIPAEHIYDTLDAHPAELRQIAESSAYVRRETASDPAPAWDERKPIP